MVVYSLINIITMPLGIIQCADNFINNLSGSSISFLYVNPCYLSLLLACIILIIVVCIGTETKIKLWFYIFLASLFSIFLHNQALLSECKKTTGKGESELILGGLSSNTMGGEEIQPDVIGALEPLDDNII